MDEPGLDAPRHAEALRALARANRLSLTAWRVWTEVRRIDRAREGEPRVRPPDSGGLVHEPATRVEPAPRRRAVRVLDIACGGGDVLRDVAALALRHEVPVELQGCDISGTALEAARRAVPTLRFFRLDVRADSLPRGYDLLCSSLFLHHLADQEAVRLLGRMKTATAHSVLVEDLRRSRAGYLLARVGLSLLTRSDVARTDGPRSVRAAFRLEEVRAMCEEAGMDGVEVRRCWPQRFTVRWSRA